MKTEAQGNLRAVSGLADTLLPIAAALIEQDFGAGQLVLAAKLSFLRAAVRATARPGKRPNVSRLSVVTGMTRKEVSFLLRNTESAVARKMPRLALEHRALRVMRGWLSDPIFTSPSGRPAELSLKGGKPAFSDLVRAYGGDVTPGSVLKELERTNAITRTDQNKLRLKVARERLNGRSPAHVEEFAQLLKDFAGTVGQPLQSRESAPLYFGFRDSRLANENAVALFQRTFARRAAGLLASVEQWDARHRTAAGVRAAHVRRRGTRVGLGVYLVQNKQHAGRRKAREDEE